MTVLKATEPSVWVTTTVEVWLPLSYAASPAWSVERRLAVSPNGAAIVTGVALSASTTMTGVPLVASFCA